MTRFLLLFKFYKYITIFILFVIMLILSYSLQLYIILRNFRRIYFVFWKYRIAGGKYGMH